MEWFALVSALDATGDLAIVQDMLGHRKRPRHTTRRSGSEEDEPGDVHINAARAFWCLAHFGI